jgi:hypothetical protein
VPLRPAFRIRGVDFALRVEIGHHDEFFEVGVIVFLGDMRLETTEIAGELDRLRRIHFLAPEHENDIVQKRLIHFIPDLFRQRLRHIDADDLRQQGITQLSYLDWHGFSLRGPGELVAGDGPGTEP